MASKNVRKTPEMQDDEMKYGDITVRREGTTIVMPPDMPYDEAIAWMERKRDEDEESVAYHEVIEAYPLDAVHALMLALKEKYGWTKMEPTPGFFGPQPPVMVTIPTGITETVQVPWGRIAIPGVEGFLNTGITLSKKGQIHFVLNGMVRNKDKAKFAAIAALTRTKLKEESIYKGRAIKVDLRPISEDEKYDPTTNAPTFMDVSGVREDDLIFPTDTAHVIQDSLFTPIEHTFQVRRAGVPLKRGVLLEGPYGVGKTMAANVTAKKCVDNGWTFIYIDDVTQLPQAMAFAKAYQPAVIFAEDVDRVVDGPRDMKVDAILNTIDGVDSKDSEVIVVLTTNHIEKINKAMLRPGRLDAVVSVRAPDPMAVTRLLRLYGRNLISPETDLTYVADLLAGQIPAVIREVVERAKLSAISENPRRPMVLSEKALGRAAQSMLAQMKVVQATEVKGPTPVEQFGTSLGGALANTLRFMNQAPMNGTEKAHVIAAHLNKNGVTEAAHMNADLEERAAKTESQRT